MIKGQLDEALKYHNKSLEINKGLKNIVEMVTNYTNIGYVYLDKKNKKEAKITADNALKIVNEFKNNTGHPHPFLNLVEELIYSIDKGN